MSDRYFGTHKAPARKRSGLSTISRRDERRLWAAFWAFSVIIASAVGAAAAPGDTIGCAPGQELVVMAGGTWECRTPTAPSGSPSPSPSATQSPSPSPSTSPSPSPSVSPTATTPPATTPPATTPPPSPSPTGPPSLLKNCFSQLAACGYPTTTSTGVPAGTVLTQSSGVMNITTAGTVLANREHTGCIYVMAANVTIRNVKLHMADNCFYGISTYDVPASGPVTITDTEVTCNYAHGSALAGPNFKATRLYLDRCENGVEINANSSIVDSYIAGSEVGNSNAHGDDMQSQGGTNVTVRHNTFGGLNPITSSIITNPTQNSGWLIENNFLSAGAYSLYCPENGTNFTVRNNRFYPAKLYFSLGDRHSAAYGLVDACSHSGIAWSGNYDDNTLRTVSSTGALA